MYNASNQRAIAMTIHPYLNEPLLICIIFRLLRRSLELRSKILYDESKLVLENSRRISTAN